MVNGFSVATFGGQGLEHSVHSSGIVPQVFISAESEREHVGDISVGKQHALKS